MSKHPKTMEDARCCIGGPQTGKTQWLLARAKDLVEQGETSVLVFCASDWLASRFTKGLETSGDGTASKVTITTPRAYAEQVAYEPAAREITGRRGRVMEPYEQRLFFEDMRTITMKGRRIRDILGFLYRELSELHDKHDWDATYEEEQVMQLAREILSFTGGILESELPGFAIMALDADESLREKYARSHVLIDDYGALSRGLQVFATHLATDSIAIAGDETDCGPACDEHPYPAGIAEFLEANPGAELTRLDDSARPEGIVEALAPVRSGLFDEEQSKKDAQAEQDDRTKLRPEPAQAPGIRVEVGQSMGDELKAIASIVNDAREDGKSVLVCGTDRVWRANVRRALESVGFASSSPRPPIRVRDFGNEKSIGRALDDTRAKLAADPHDSVAWRSIVGLGDYVGKSDALQRLRESAQDENLGIERALEALSRGEIAGVDVEERSMADLVARYREARNALADGSWAKSAEERAEAPASPWQESSVMIAGPGDCYGVQADIVVFGGFVNGLVPCRDYFDGSKLVGSKLAHERRVNLQRIYLVAGRAREKLVFTAFERASLEVAERLGLHIVNIKLKQGVRTATVSPSIFLRTMGLA